MCLYFPETKFLNTHLTSLFVFHGHKSINISCWPLSNQNESDVLKWVVRKEFSDLRRCLEVEETGFMQQVETSTAALISSLQNQTDQLNQNLNRLQEAYKTLQDLSNEGHLDFITVVIPSLWSVQYVVYVSWIWFWFCQSVFLRRVLII